MASKAERVHSEEDERYIRRFVSDVLTFTLKKHGLPETKIPESDCTENVYKRANIVTLAGLSVVRESLLKRDDWKKIFRLQSIGSEFKSECIPDFVKSHTCLTIPERTKQCLIEEALAFCNELILFILHKGKSVDFNMIVNSVASNILTLIGEEKNFSETVEGLFDEFVDVLDYTRWITTFIEKYASSYAASRRNVSQLFAEKVNELEKHDKKIISEESAIELLQKQGFELSDINKLFNAIGLQKSDHQSKNTGSVTESAPVKMEVNRESPESSELPARSDNTGLETESAPVEMEVNRESPESSELPARSDNTGLVTESAPAEMEGYRKSPESSELPARSDNTGLVTESAPAEMEGNRISPEPSELPARSDNTGSVTESAPAKMEGNSESPESSELSTRSDNTVLVTESTLKIEGDSESTESSSLSARSDNSSLEGQESLGEWTIRSDSAPQLTDQGDQGSKHSLESGFEDDFGKMDLAAEGASLDIQDGKGNGTQN